MLRHGVMLAVLQPFVECMPTMQICATPGTGAKGSSVLMKFLGN